MKSKLIVTTGLLTCAFASTSYAFFCPSNFNQINTGDSAAQVQQQCGKPDKTDTTDAPDNSPQEWNYYLEQASSTNIMPQMAQAAGTLKTSFAFDAQGKLVNISVNGIGVASTSNCGSPVSLGDTRQSVESACGKPSFVNKQAPSGKDQDPNANKQIEWTYNSSPPITLIFRNGVLVDSK